MYLSPPQFFGLPALKVRFSYFPAYMQTSERTCLAPPPTHPRLTKSSPPNKTNGQSLDCLRSIKLTQRGMLEAAEGSYISIEPYTGRAMQAHMAMQVRFVCLCLILATPIPTHPPATHPKTTQISTSNAAEGAPVFDVWYPDVYKAEIIPTLWMAQVRVLFFF